MSNFAFSLIFLNQAVHEKPLLFWMFIAPIWVAAQAYIQEFFSQVSVVVITLFWACDLLTGSIRAIKEGQFVPSKFFIGILRWLIWIVALVVSMGIRLSVPIAGGIIASIIESVIILAEASSILRNLALLSGEERVKRILGSYYKLIDDKVDEIIPGENNDPRLGDE